MRMLFRLSFGWMIFTAVMVVLRAQHYTLSGFVRDRATGEPLIGAAVWVPSLQSGTSTNEYGFYSLTLPKGTYAVEASYLGYDKFSTSVTLHGDRRLNIDLRPVSLQLHEVKVVEEKTDFVKGAQMSVVEVPIEKLQTLPVVFGEADLLKTIQLLPGVQSGGEGFSGFYVRGGSGDQNLILLDEGIVYNPDHAAGFFSSFNPDVIKSSTLYKGGIPARYGGRLSSVLDIRMREGSMRQWQAVGGLGLISSRLTVEGPLVRDKASILIAGRRMYADIIAQPFLKGKPAEGNRYYFYDLNLKTHIQLNDKNRLYLSAYQGRDVFSFKSADFDFAVGSQWGNRTLTLRWNRIIHDKLFSNTSIIYNDYIWKQYSGQTGVFEASIANRVEDLLTKADLTYYPRPNHTVRFGIHYGRHHYAPFQYEAVFRTDTFTNRGEHPKTVHDLAAYISTQYNITPRWKVEAGLRAAAFLMWGPYTEYQLNEWYEITDKKEYGADQLVAFYPHIEPRVNIRWQVNENASIKASYNRMTQFVHRVNFSSISLPFDQWMPSSPRVKPQIGDQVAAGFFHSVPTWHIDWSVEAFYKRMANQLEFRDGFTPELDRETELDLVVGRGESYGTELMVEKKQGNLTGWIAYTYSRSWRYFDNLYSKKFPFSYDQPHDLSVVAQYRLSPRWTFGGTFVYKSGRPFTVPTSAYLIEGQLVYEYTTRNGYRMIPYHRLDLSVNYYSRFRLFKRKVQSHLNLSIYNVYRRKNPFIVYFPIEGSPTEGLKVSPQMIYIFDILPSITWNFKL